MIDIKLENVTFIRNNRKIINDVSLEFPSGKTSVIIGPSGCGKSTLLKITAGLIPPTTGKVYVDGVNLLTMNRKELLDFRKKSGFVFQDAALWANKSVYDNMILPLQVHFPEMNADEKDKKIRSMLEAVGYTDSLLLRPAQLSNGERKMVSLARALVISPVLLYMDTPLTLVDPSVSAKMERLILDLHSSDNTIISNFANPSLTKRISDFTVVMKDGRVISTGTIKQISGTGDREISDTVSAVLYHQNSNSV